MGELRAWHVRVVALFTAPPSTHLAIVDSACDNRGSF
jgi:hypothetical protein